MIHHPKQSMIEIKSIAKPHVLPPKEPAAILPRMMEFQSLVAEGMTPAEAMEKIEGRYHKAILPNHQMSSQTGVAKKKRARGIGATEAVASGMGSEWVTCRELALVLGVPKSSVWGSMQILVRDGRVEAAPRKGHNAVKYRRTGPQASDATRNSAEGHAPTGGAIWDGKQQSEGKA